VISGLLPSPYADFKTTNGCITMPLGQYAVGNLFFKPDEEALKQSIVDFEELATTLGRMPISRPQMAA
jgi:hypothetical protein